ncbi:hypothetical protein NEOLI_002341 [Neolecta irregularis DAH-3]|uniref:Uncharacterized protein n=1 Tax=Neolecta irregularis (strain DAH-3) TaxID=1198029 RepID=A0A1U7LG84_NEOID|nr:hypothetical protein NEOLI_002341 [Neolecta irregularis DAH-3]|eukprot:OLL21665.1 hypothetical protein NEOLI_002341 [Neolecta irregularis DAH-3]
MLMRILVDVYKFCIISPFMWPPTTLPRTLYFCHKNTRYRASLKHSRLVESYFRKCGTILLFKPFRMFKENKVTDELLKTRIVSIPLDDDNATQVEITRANENNFNYWNNELARSVLGSFIGFNRAIERTWKKKALERENSSGNDDSSIV